MWAINISMPSSSPAPPNREPSGSFQTFRSLSRQMCPSELLTARRPQERRPCRRLLSRLRALVEHLPRPAVDHCDLHRRDMAGLLGFRRIFDCRLSVPLSSIGNERFGPANFFVGILARAFGVSFAIGVFPICHQRGVTGDISPVVIELRRLTYDELAELSRIETSGTSFRGRIRVVIVSSFRQRILSP